VGTAFERLSSGLRINSASDDAAGLAVAAGLNLEARISRQGVRNLNDAISLLSVGESAISELKNITSRISELAQAAANGSYSNRQRAALDQEAQLLAAEYGRIVSTTTFNGIAVLEDIGDVSFQAGRSTIVQSLGVSLAANTAATGTFGAAISSSSTSGASDIKVADLNGDGLDDIVRLNGASSYVATYLSQGDGSYTVSFTANAGLAGPAGRGLTIGDIDSDGDNDLAYYVPIGVGAMQYLQIALNDGSGGFTVGQLLDAGRSLYDVELGDLNGDGNLDMVAITGNNNSYHVYLGNGNGTFTALATSNGSAGQDPGAITLGDFDGDSALDMVIVSNNGTPQFRYFRNTGSGTFAAYTAFDSGFAAVDVESADFNNDGNLDVINSAGRIVLGNGNGTFGTGAATGLSGMLDVADVNGDGNMDVLSITTSAFFVSLGNGDGTFAAATSITTAAGLTDTGIGDFNGDGVLDLAAVNSTTGALVTVFQDAATSAGLPSIDLTTRESALAAISTMEVAQQTLDQKAGVFGAGLRRLEIASNLLAVNAENYKTAEHRIIDADIASEVAELIAQNVRREVGSAILAQANLQGDIVLKLIRG
jgi:flagellin